VSGATEKHNSFLTCSMSCFAHAINLAVGAFINTLSPKRPSSSDTGEDEYVVPGPVAGQSYNESDVAGEEDDDEMVEVLRQKVKEMEKEPGGEVLNCPSIVSAPPHSSFCVKGKGSGHLVSFADYPSDRFAGARRQNAT